MKDKTMESLHARFSAGRTDLIFDLLKLSTVDINDPIGGASILQWCAYYGDVSAMRIALDAGARLDELGEDLGLRGAAFHGHWRLCEFLLERGADVNHRDPINHESALHAALCHDDRTKYDLVLRVLLAAGADVNIATIANASTSSFMRDSRTRAETALHRAAACGTAETVQLLLDAGADRQRRDAFGDSALAWGSWYRRPVEVLRLLCFDEYRIHPDYQPLRNNLLGHPLSL
ncbi:ankyrin repeat domain-containing protein [Undibacterium flavidum]|uniref:Ankyrin repeat domain-containing protein n=1 Tax=Undibacterium flavidum TaxID=2762297 RepID=A0ABR6Y6X9_9BURK|nr:ankyrin repeat domain-containing protein [Undibacterium flavidum]MBC3872374.1 ankyrin repeat domain-containing protein [Undibacterium flavidum]